MRHPSVVFAAFLTAACARSPTALPAVPLAAPEHAPAGKGSTVPCPIQTMGCFQFVGSVRAGQDAPMPVTGWNVDQPTPGYANFWYYELTLPPGDRTLKSLVGRPRQALSHGKAVVGGYFQEAFVPWQERNPIFWRLDMQAVDPAIAARFTAVAGSEETRLQWFTVEYQAEGTAKILIYEPCPGGAEWCPPGG